jgi:hypothetical protein
MIELSEALHVDKMGAVLFPDLPIFSHEFDAVNKLYPAISSGAVGIYKRPTHSAVAAMITIVTSSMSKHAHTLTSGSAVA